MPEDYKNKDFTDYFLLFLNSGKEGEFFTAFNDLVKGAKKIEEVYPEIFETEGLLKKEYEEYKEVDFYDSINEKYINQPISFRAMVRGEAAKPYIYPTEVKITCGITRGDKCSQCGLFLVGGSLTTKLDAINPLELIDCNEQQKNSLIKRKVGVIQCGQFKIEVVKQRYIQELFLSPMVTELSDERKEQRFIIRHAFSEGASVIPNKAYRFYGIPTASPKNQSLVFYIKRAEEEENDLDNFKLSEADINDLKIFQPENGIQEKLDDIYRDFSVNLSPAIRFRDDIMLACDLSFHSVLGFWFGKSFEKKGWVECLIVGDTSVGKSKITEKLINHYQLGVIQGAENSTIAGLIGGMTRFESINIMTWGLLPLNNSRLVALDEMSGIKKEIFGELTRIRSEGIAERTIVGGSSSTQSKVRLIWLSNPRKRPIRLYDSGCDMIKELVGLDEDISRFDFILPISEGEVKTEDINTKVSTGSGFLMKHKYKSDLCNKLVLWAWSRKAKNVIFDKGVEGFILECAIEMANRYTSNFPLVLGSTIRLKLARLSIALATRLFSTKDGENVFVTTEHVDYIFYWLNKIYCKPSFGYGEYSDYFKESSEKSEDVKDDLMMEIKNYAKDYRGFIMNMLQNSRITALEIRDFLGGDAKAADNIRIKLVANGFLIKKAGFYVKSGLFRRTLKKELAI